MTRPPDDLIAGYFAGDADDASVAALAAWVRSHPDHARHFAIAAVVHAGVREHFRAAAPGGIRPASWHRTAVRALAAAAVLMLASAAAFVWFKDRPSSALWADDVGAVWAVHDAHVRGLQRLTAGAARLQFRSGASVIVQAPAEFTVDGDELRLVGGRLVATCPTERSRALAVRVGDTRIRDLGTQFGVEATPGGGRLEVFQGAVEYRRRDVATVYRAGDTHEFGGPRLARPAAQWLMPAAFDLSVRKAGGGPAARWSVALAGLLRDPTLAFATHTNAPEIETTDLVSGKALRSSSLPTLSSDRFGRVAAVVVGEKSAAPAGGLSRTFDSLTLWAWVKLDGPAAMPDWHRGLLMTDGWDRPGQVHWQCKNDGLRISFFGRGDDLDTRFPAKPQGLTDGQWHLLTTTVQRMPRTHVTHYLDGAVVFDRVIDAPTPPLRLDSFLVGGWRDGVSADVQRPLYGAIDDVLVWGRALPADEVKRLYESSRP